MLAGNHEGAMHAAMRKRTPRDVAEWCAMGGTKVLREMAIYRHLLRSVSTPGNEPVRGVDDYLQRMPRNKPIDWHTLLAEAGPEQIDCGQAMSAMTHFCETRVRALFERTEILTRPLPGVLAVHAGLGLDAVAMGSTDMIVAAWRAFRVGGATEKLRLGGAADQDVMAFREAMWDRRDKGTDVLLGRTVCNMLRDENVTLVIRGHDRTLDQEPAVHEEHKGVHSIDVDGGKDGDCYVKITPDGNVISGSASGGEQRLGKMKKGAFMPED